MIGLDILADWVLPVLLYVYVMIGLGILADWVLPILLYVYIIIFNPFRPKSLSCFSVLIWASVNSNYHAGPNAQKNN